MKKKWTYLAVAGMLLGTAPVFTGCVDNDEPAGIEQLRGAKAQLLQAKAAVEEAVALVEQANAEYRQAEAQWKRAKAAQEEYKAELKRLQVELQEAKNEKEKVRLEKDIQDLRNQMEGAALQHQINMLDLQKQFALVQRQYEIVMQEIEISDAIGSEQARVSLSSLKEAVQDAYEALYVGIDGDAKSSLYYQLEKAQERLYNAQLNQAHGIINEDANIFIPQLEYNVAAAQSHLDAQKEVYEKYAEYLTTDVTTADWRAEIKTWEDEIAKVKKNWDEAYTTVETLKASGKYLEASQNLYGIYEKGESMEGASMSKPDIEGITQEYPDNWGKAVGGAWPTYQKALGNLNDLKHQKEDAFTLAAPATAMPTIPAYLQTFLEQAESAYDPTVSTGSYFDWSSLNIEEDLTYGFWSSNDEAIEYNPAEGKYATVPVNKRLANFKYAMAILDEAAEMSQNATVQVAREALDKWVTETHDTWVKAIDTEYHAAFDTALKAITDAETKLLEADKAMAAAKEEVDKYELEVLKWKDTYNAYTTIKNKLVEAVNNNLDLDGIIFTDTEQFEQDLKNIALQWQNNIVGTELQLANAQVELEKAQNGEYNDVTYAQYLLDVANYNFNKGWEEYQEALNNLNTALAAIAEDEEGGNAEQPGDDNQDPAGEEEQPAE